MQDTRHEVHPSEWVLPNRKGFNDWFYQTFHPDDYPSTSGTGKQIRLFPHQRLVRDYVQFNSPYRGILLYHGLGVGKTCASIAAAEGFLGAHRKVYVLLPASLAKNYQAEILRCSTLSNPTQKRWNLVNIPSKKEDADRIRTSLADYLKVDVAFLKKFKKQIWIPRLPDDVPAVKTKVPWRDLSDLEKEAVNSFMNEWIQHKYIFISYNGLTRKKLKEYGEDAFHNSFVVMDEAHNFISRSSRAGSVARKLYDMLMAGRNMKMVLLSGTPVINHPFELCRLLNLVRGPMQSMEVPMLKATPMMTEESLVRKFYENGLWQFIDTIHIRLQGESKRVTVSLLPYHYQRSEDDPNKVTSIKWPNKVHEIFEQVHDCLQQDFKMGKKVSFVSSYALPETLKEFQAYFLDESDPENPVLKNQDLFTRRIAGLVSYFRKGSEEDFPTMLPPQLVEIPMANFQFAKYLKERETEQKMERARQRFGNTGGVFAKNGSVYRAFSRMACNFVFPETIDRPYPKDLRKQLKDEIAVNEDDTEGESEEDEDAGDVKDSIEKEKGIRVEAKHRYDERIAAAMKALRENPNFVKSQQLTNMYSPKFAHMLKDIEESPGSCLLYSQFRTVEGLGVFRLCLEADGYVEVQVEKKGGEWTIVDAESVFDPKYDRKRFVVFNEDREKTEILMRIFNGLWKPLPTSVQTILNKYAGENGNLYGDMVRVMMISQSGAEGISLKNVRRVLITEPFWNQVRIDQVIGRAVRTGSHKALPPEDQNVQVFMYVSKFTPEQVKSSRTLQRIDGSNSSDQHILNIATNKNRIIQSFLTMAKKAAMDCMFNAPKNLPKEEGFQCYSFPINMSDDHLSYATSFVDEPALMEKTKFERRRKIQGRVVSRGNKKYVMLDDQSQLYDYHAYKDAGVLVPANL